MCLDRLAFYSEAFGGVGKVEHLTSTSSQTASQLAQHLSLPDAGQFECVAFEQLLDVLVERTQSGLRKSPKRAPRSPDRCELQQPIRPQSELCDCPAAPRKPRAQAALAERFDQQMTRVVCGDKVAGDADKLLSAGPIRAILAAMTTELFNLGADDFAEQPWIYPGTPSPYSGLLQNGCYRKLDPKPKRRLGQACVHLNGDGRSESLNFALLMSNSAAVDNRHIVVAVGSNGSPAVLRRKFASRGVSTTVPMINAQVAGLRIGHSAHISVPGYLAATPILSPLESTPVIVSFLDGEQLECLDQTEPNYSRKLVDSSDCQLTIDGGETPSSFLIYVSRWGVLAPPKNDPFNFMDQDAVYAKLRRECEPFADLVGDDSHRTVIQRFAADESLRGTAAEVFKNANWVSQSGFEGTVERAVSARYGSVGTSWNDVSPDSNALVCLPSMDSLNRRGEQCVTLHPQDAIALGSPSHLALKDVHGLAIGSATARLNASASQPRGSAGTDQVLRNSLGVEIREFVTVTPVHVPTTPLADRVVSQPHFSMVRVQPADLATVEQNVGLLSPLAMSLLGLLDGDEVVMQGAPNADGKVSNVRMNVHAVPEETMTRRERLSGGGLNARFPSAKDALGVFPDLPWLFLDSASRARLNIEGKKLGVVRVRASRRFQLIREFRELLLLLVLAFVGLATVVKSQAILMVLLGGLFLAAVIVVRSRLKSRLENRR